MPSDSEHANKTGILTFTKRFITKILSLYVRLVNIFIEKMKKHMRLSTIVLVCVI